MELEKFQKNLNIRNASIILNQTPNKPLGPATFPGAILLKVVTEVLFFIFNLKKKKRK